MTNDGGQRSSATEPAGSERPPWLAGAYGGLFALGLAAFVAVGLLLALTVPYHDWDAFAFGELSRAVQNGGYALTDFSAAVVHRPLFYVVQGWLWAAFGFSFASGRLLGLGFAVVLVISVAWLGRTPGARLGGLTAVLAGTALISIPELSTQAISGLSDVPAAAMVGVTAAVALTPGRGRSRAIAIVLLAFLAVLTKPSVLAPLAGLIIAVELAARRPRVGSEGTTDGEARADRAVTFAPLVAGVAAGLVVHLAASLRLGVGFLDYLTAGTSDYWAQRADEERWGALARLDVLGPHLRLPLAFVLLYTLARLLRVTHRVAATAALLLAVAWTTIGSALASDPERPLWTAQTAFTWAGFLGWLALFCAVTEHAVPDRSRITDFALIGFPPLAVWWYATPYAERLASTAWPGLAALIGITLAPAVIVLARNAGVAALAPALVLGLAVWASLASFDGFGADQWREYKSLGRDGIRDEGRTLNIVLPSIQATIEAVRPALGDEGRLSTTDPRLSWWFPGRVSLGYVTTCEQLDGYAAFVLLTSDESRAQLEDLGGNGDPAWWAGCEEPRLTQLTDGENGFAVFAVEAP